MFSACIANPDLWSPNYNDPIVDSGGTNGSDPVEVTSPSTPPTLTKVAESKCENLDPQYLWSMKEVKKGEVIRRVKKVKVCHQTGNTSSHTIVIACPALRGLYSSNSLNWTFLNPSLVACSGEWLIIMIPPPVLTLHSFRSSSTSRVLS